MKMCVAHSSHFAFRQINVFFIYLFIRVPVSLMLILQIVYFLFNNVFVGSFVDHFFLNTISMQVNHTLFLLYFIFGTVVVVDVDDVDFNIRCKNFLSIFFLNKIGWCGWFFILPLFLLLLSYWKCCFMCDWLIYFSFIDII